MPPALSSPRDVRPCALSPRAPGLSSADLYTFAGVVAVEAMGGPAVPFAFGRSDTTDGATSPPDGEWSNSTLRRGRSSYLICPFRSLIALLRILPPSTLAAPPLSHLPLPPLPVAVGMVRLKAGSRTQTWAATWLRPSTCATSSTAWALTTARSWPCPAPTPSAGERRSERARVHGEACAPCVCGVCLVSACEKAGAGH